VERQVVPDVAPETGNARLPTKERRTGGTSRPCRQMPSAKTNLITPEGKAAVGWNTKYLAHVYLPRWYLILILKYFYSVRMASLSYTVPVPRRQQVSQETRKA